MIEVKENKNTVICQFISLTCPHVLTYVHIVELCFRFRKNTFLFHQFKYTGIKEQPSLSYEVRNDT